MANENDLIKQAQQLLDDIKKSGNDFDEKMSKIFSDADKIVKELENTDLDKELGQIEKESVKEMDKAVLDFLEEEKEEEEEE
ncbi:MAG: hypothetical protein V1877_00050 [Candidatus Tagabacteria bacterium]